MRSTWPWEAEFRLPPPELNIGSEEDVFGAGLWQDVPALQRTVSLLCSGIPGEDSFYASVTAAGFEVTIKVELSQCKFQKRIVRTGETLEIASDMYFLPEDLRGSGLGRRMFRNSLIAYDELGADFVVATANYINGGYTWAKLAGRCVEPEETRPALLQRLSQLSQVEKFSKLDVEALEKVINEAPDETMMYQIACCKNQQGRDLGRALLTGATWETFWDLNDGDQRALMAEALK